MKASHVLLISSCSVLALLFAPGSGWAVTATVPGNFTCTTTSCFNITDNVSQGHAITGTASSGIAVVGTGQVGVNGVSNGSGEGVVGNSVSGVGIFGTSGSSTGISGLGSNGVVGSSNNITGFGVEGIANSTGTGSGVFGDAGGSFTAWAGNYNGDVQARGYYNSSDARLKREIKDAPFGLYQLLKLRPVTYKWKTESSDGDVQMGLIAQEVQKIFPNVVRTDGRSGILSINYTELLPVVIKAVQEQQKVIDLQEARISKLERERAPITSSLLPVGLGGGVALALLPLGLIVGTRRRKNNSLQ